MKVKIMIKNEKEDPSSKVLVRMAKGTSILALSAVAGTGISHITAESLEEKSHTVKQQAKNRHVPINERMQMLSDASDLSQRAEKAEEAAQWLPGKAVAITAISAASYFGAGPLGAAIKKGKKGKSRNMSDQLCGDEERDNMPQTSFAARVMRAAPAIIPAAGVLSAGIGFGNIVHGGIQFHQSRLVEGVDDNSLPAQQRQDAIQKSVKLEDQAEASCKTGSNQLVKGCLVIGAGIGGYSLLAQRRKPKREQMVASQNEQLIPSR